MEKSKMSNVAAGFFTQYENELDESNQIFKCFENFIGDDKIENDVLNKLFENNMKETINYEKDGIYKKISINRFIEL